MGGGSKESYNFSLQDIDAFVFYDKPFLKFERLLETYLTTAPKGLKSFIKSIPIWLKDKLFLKELLAKEFMNLYKELYPNSKDAKRFKQKVFDNLYFSEHHISHAASAFFPSPFESAAILTIDGVGEWCTTSIGKGEGNEIDIYKEIHFPHSLGLLYSAFTYYLGFKVNSGEYKVMGLSPYGEPKYIDLIKKHLIDIKDDGSFRLNMDYFPYTHSLKMTNAAFDKLFFNSFRTQESSLKQIHMDIAASLQRITEEIMLKLSFSAKNFTNSKNLVLSGGVALNCVGNGLIYKKLIKEEKIFENIWIQPSSGDSGSALGAAYAFYYIESKFPRKINSKDRMQGAFLGISYSNDYVENILKNEGVVFEKLQSNEIIKRAAYELSLGKIIGWHQGRSEFGPRALGARSILGDPRDKNMQKNMNLKIKFRESFRPFAPSILDSKLEEYFDLDIPSPYMLLVAKVKKEKCFEMDEKQKELFGIDKLNVIRSEVPSITHVDYSARIQSVHKSTNPKYYSLLEEFYKLTSCPILINTSFNVRGEPIVCSPKDSLKCFLGTNIDVLVIEDFILYKEKQPKELKAKYANFKDSYELD